MTDLTTLFVERSMALLDVEELASTAQRRAESQPLPALGRALEESRQKHLTPRLVRKYCRRSSLPIFLAAGPLRHLCAGCGTCLAAIESAEPPADVPATKDPFVALLRSLATPDRDRLTPIERLMRRRLGRDPLATAWLLFEQCMTIASPHRPTPPQAVAAGIELLANVTAELSEVAFQQLHCLSRLYLAKARLIAGWDVEDVTDRLREGVGDIKRFAFGQPGENRELIVLFTEIASRIEWERGDLESAARISESEVELLSGACHAEWRANRLNDYALNLVGVGLAESARKTWKLALADMNAESSPLLLLGIYHNLVLNEYVIAQTQAAASASAPDFGAARNYLDASQALAEQYGSDLLLLNRKLIREMIEEPAPAVREATLREALVLCDARENVVMGARALLELILMLIQAGRGQETEPLFDELASRVLRQPEVAQDCARLLSSLERAQPRHPANVERLKLLRRLAGSTTVH